MSHFYFSWKLHKTSGFLTFSGVVDIWVMLTTLMMSSSVSIADSEQNLQIFCCFDCKIQVLLVDWVSGFSEQPLFNSFPNAFLLQLLRINSREITASSKLFGFARVRNTQLAITCSKLTIDTIKLGVKYV